MHVPQNHLIVSSGATRSWIDPVRFLTNASTGKMGYSIAAHAKDFFEERSYVCGAGAARAYQQVEAAHNVLVESTRDMYDAIEQIIIKIKERDDTTRIFLIMAAAPLDYEVEFEQEEKIKKDKQNTINLELISTIDILKTLTQTYKKNNDDNFIAIGFAAETTITHEAAYKKLIEKNLDLICSNQVYKQSHGFADSKNTLYLLDQAKNTITLGPAHKEKLAYLLLSHIKQAWMQV